MMILVVFFGFSALCHVSLNLFPWHDVFQNKFTILVVATLTSLDGFLLLFDFKLDIGPLSLIFPYL